MTDDNEQRKYGSTHVGTCVCTCKHARKRSGFLNSLVSKGRLEHEIEETEVEDLKIGY